MTQHKQPEWVRKAAQDVTAFLHQQQEHAALAKEHLQESQAKVKPDLQTAEAKVKVDVQQTQEKIADIIHRHFQEHK